MSNPVDLAIETIGAPFGLIDILALFFCYVYPAILIYVVEFGNVTFRLLAKRCDRQPKAVPIIAYLLALSVISGLIAGIAFLAIPNDQKTRNMLKLASLVAAVIIVRILYSCEMKCRTKYIYDKHKKSLLGGHKELHHDPERQYYQNNQDYSYPQEHSHPQDSHHKRKSFSQLLFGFWSLMGYELTQKLVLLMCLSTVQYISIIQIVVAYILLAITILSRGRKLAKLKPQLKLQMLGMLGIVLWVINNCFLVR